MVPYSPKVWPWILMAIVFILSTISSIFLSYSYPLKLNPFFDCRTIYFYAVTTAPFSILRNLGSPICFFVNKGRRQFIDWFSFSNILDRMKMTVGDLVVGGMHSNSVRVTDDTTGGTKYQFMFQGYLAILHA